MKLIAKVFAPRTIKASEMKDGDIGIGVSDFVGEIFFRNVAGLHNIGGDSQRYWPSEYIEHRRGSKHIPYMPEFSVQLFVTGDTITVE
jgi:hypothetical protein